jgi:hypothetical protein
MRAYARADGMITLSDKLSAYSITQLLAFADSLDPNNGWRESIAEDDSISRDDLADAMLAAYDDADTHAWINFGGRRTSASR